MVVSDTVAAVEFLRAVFGALGEVPADRPAEMRIGDSLIMVSSAGEREAFPAFLAVYVNDVYVDIHVDTADAAYHRALTFLPTAQAGGFQPALGGLEQ